MGAEAGKEKQYTALVRYSKKMRRQGERHKPMQWVATVTFVYSKLAMKLEDRNENPLGFQVIKYRNDQESGGTL